MIETQDKTIPLSILIHQYKRKFIDLKMDEMICNANMYSVFLEGKATKDEMRTILKKTIRDSRLIMTLNLAATVSNLDLKEIR